MSMSREQFRPARLPNTQLLRARSSSFPVATFTPTQYPGLAHWSDVFDAGSMELSYGAKITGSGPYLSTADHADLDPSGGFSLEFWRNCSEAQDAALPPTEMGLDRCFVSQNVHGSQQSWQVGSGRSSGHGKGIAFWWANHVSNNDYDIPVANTAGPDWSMAFIQVNPAGATDRR